MKIFILFLLVRNAQTAFLCPPLQRHINNSIISHKCDDNINMNGVIIKQGIQGFLFSIFCIELFRGIMIFRQMNKTKNNLNNSRILEDYTEYMYY